jgi:hypothetical protein
MPVNGQVPVQRSVLPAGEAGVDATVMKMVEMAKGRYGAKSAKIRALAIDILNAARVPEKDYYGEAVAIFEWVRDNIRYLKDPIGQETLSYPEELAFNSKAADCDDKTMLVMALLGSIGIQSYPVVVGVRPDMFSHVYLHAVIPPGKHRMAGQVVPMDPIMREWPAGKEAQAPRVQKKKTYPQLAGLDGMDNFIPGIGGDMLPGMGLGSYVAAPSYLDTENSQAAKLLASGSAGGTAQVRADRNSMVNKDGTVATTTRSVQGLEGADAMFADRTPVIAPKWGQPGAFVTGREDKFGRIWNNSPQILDARDTGSSGPMIGRQAEAMTRVLQSERAKEIPTLMGTKTVVGQGSNKRTIVTVQSPQKAAKGRPAPMLDRPMADAVREIKGLGTYLGAMQQCLAGCGDCGGLGYAWDGAPSKNNVVVDTALVSFWARLKSDLMTASAKVIDQYAAQYPTAEAKQDAQIAKEAAKEAEKVAKEAEKAEKTVAATPEAKAAVNDVKVKLATENATNGFGFMIEGLGALPVNAVKATLPVGLVGTMMTRERIQTQQQLDQATADQQLIMAKIEMLRRKLAEIVNREQSRTNRPEAMLYQGPVKGASAATAPQSWAARHVTATTTVAKPSAVSQLQNAFKTRQASVQGLGEGIVDTIKKPMTMALLAAGVLGALYLRKKAK